MNSDKVTVPEIRSRKQAGPKLAVVTAYDATMARLLDAGGADILLVGDSLGMVVQGLPNTLPVTLDEICYHGRAVARAAQRAHVVGDMPFMTFQVSSEHALQAAGEMLKRGGFEAVKLEGGVSVAEQVHRIVASMRPCQFSCSPPAGFLSYPPPSLPRQVCPRLGFRRLPLLFQVLAP